VSEIQWCDRTALLQASAEDERCWLVWSVEDRWELDNGPSLVERALRASLLSGETSVHVHLYTKTLVSTSPLKCTCMSTEYVLRVCLVVSVCCVESVEFERSLGSGTFSLLLCQHFLFRSPAAITLRCRDHACSPPEDRRRAVAGDWQ